MSRPYFVDEREFIPGRALVAVGGMSCGVCNGTEAHLSQSGHTIQCDDCGFTEYVLHGSGTLEDDVRAAGFAFVGRIV